MASMKVEAHVLRDPTSTDEKVGKIDYTSGAGAQRDAATMKAIVEGATVPIHMTSVRYNPVDKKVYCGLSARENDLLWTFDPQAKQFSDCGFNRISDKDDTKIHRSLEIASDGVVYGGTSGWTGLGHSGHEYGARGGTVFSYDPGTGELKSYGIPCPNNYIQNTVYDEQRNVIYGCTHPGKELFRMRLDTGDVKRWFIDTLTHRVAIDDSGCVWGVYSGNNFFKYSPDEDRVHYLDFGPLGVSSGWDVASVGSCIDGIVNGADGYLYIGTEAGTLCRLDPSVPELTYLGKPLAGGRMSGLVVGKDGRLFLGTGCGRITSLVTYDRDTGVFTDYGLIRDEDRNATSAVAHQITQSDDGTIYCGETDQQGRSGYLWECRLED